MTKIAFIAIHYAELSAFLVASWGVAKPILRRVNADGTVDGWLENTFACVLGLGLLICAFQLLAISGVLRTPVVWGVLAAGMVAALVRSPAAAHSAIQTAIASWKAQTYAQKLSAVALALIIFSNFLGPLRPPQDWDELMYHLPRAQQWAITGSLGIQTWLRYPWFPSNYELLYSAALLVGDDVLPHLLHAASGWLVAILIFFFAKRQYKPWLGWLASAMWVFSTRGALNDAYIDGGVALFVTAAAVAFYLWSENPQRKHWVWLSAFLLGVAAGTKYQALVLLPLFTVSLVVVAPRAPQFGGAVVAFLVPCAYWYLRNAVQTGDPFDPIGGKVFGFTDWNAADLQAQFQDMKRVADWPAWYLWPAMAAPLLHDTRNLRFFRIVLVYSSYFFATWVLTSHYSRYAMPAYPAWAILSAMTWGGAGIALWRALTRLRVPLPSNFPWRTAKTIGGSVLVLLLAANVLAYSRNNWRHIPATPQDREQILRKVVPGYEVLSYLRHHLVGKAYQIGLDGSIYYAPHPIWGDIFGPWRYRDYATLPPTRLWQKLRSGGFCYLVLAPGVHIPDQDGKFRSYFSPIYAKDGAEIDWIFGTTACVGIAARHALHTGAAKGAPGRHRLGSCRAKASAPRNHRPD